MDKSVPFLRKGDFNGRLNEWRLTSHPVSTDLSISYRCINMFDSSPIQTSLGYSSGLRPNSYKRPKIDNSWALCR